MAVWFWYESCEGAVAVRPVSYRLQTEDLCPDIAKLTDKVGRLPQEGYECLLSAVFLRVTVLSHKISRDVSNSHTVRVSSFKIAIKYQHGGRAKY